MSLRDKRYPRPEEESRRRRVRLGAPHHAGPVDAARRDKPVADLEEQFSELGVELRTARERLAHYESFSSATIAVLDRRMRQLVADLEKTLQELAGLKEDSEKRIAALEEENLSLHRAGGDARNESPGEISEVERKTPEIDIDAGGGPEIKPRSASPLDFLFRRHDEPDLQEPPPAGPARLEPPPSEEGRGGLEARPAAQQKPVGADSTRAETRDRGGQVSATPMDELKNTANEIADTTDDPEKRPAALELENVDLPRVIAETTNPTLEEENMRLHQAIALATGDSRKEGHPSDLTDSHPSTSSLLPPVPEAKPRPSAIVEHHATETTEAGSGEGEVQLIVSPFSSFGAINRFTSALRSVPGVSSATIQSFQKGRLQVSVDYAGVVPLGHRLEELSEFRVFSEFRVRVIESSQGRLEALIESSEERGRGSPSRGV